MRGDFHHESGVEMKWIKIEPALMILGNFMGKTESETRAFATGLRGEEWLKYFCLNIIRNSFPGISDKNLNVISYFKPFDRNPFFFLAINCIESVVEEVKGKLGNLNGPALQSDLWWNLDVQFHVVLTESFVTECERVIHDLRQRFRLVNKGPESGRTPQRVIFTI